ncbi:hypothetical protein CN326_23900, partial [Bacillus sp. AFS018417]|uniref:hypothetical protein n=1 Tax=Bacillus sp. AFS018417 TaxID=2033491 RepID=UPI000BFAC839
TKSDLTMLNKMKTSFINGKPKFNKTSKEQQMGRYKTNGIAKIKRMQENQSVGQLKTTGITTFLNV